MVKTAWMRLIKFLSLKASNNFFNFAEIFLRIYFEVFGNFEQFRILNSVVNGNISKVFSRFSRNVPTFLVTCNNFINFEFDEISKTANFLGIIVIHQATPASARFEAAS